jgi:hypothetical protein
LLARHLLVFCPTAQLQLGAAGCESVIHSFLLASLDHLHCLGRLDTNTKAGPRAQAFRRPPPYHSTPYPGAFESLPVSDVANLSRHAPINMPWIHSYVILQVS